MTRREECGQGDFAERLAAARSGDRAALEELLDGLQPWLHREADKRMGEHVAARARPSDVTQDALVEVVRLLPTFQGDSQAQFHSWVRAIVETSARQAARWHNAQKRKVPSRTSQLRALADELLPRVRSPATELVRAESVALLHRALESLREDHRMIIEQVSLGGRTVTAVAKELGRTDSSTRMLLSRARVALTQALQRLDPPAP